MIASLALGGGLIIMGALMWFEIKEYCNMNDANPEFNEGEKLK